MKSRYKFILFIKWLLFLGIIYSNTFAASGNEVKPIIVFTENNNRVEKITFSIPGKYGENSEWKLYFDSIEDKQKIDEGKIDVRGVVKTLTLQRKNQYVNTAYLIIYDKFGSLIDFVHLKTGLKESNIKIFIENYGGILSGACLGFFFSIIIYLIQEMIKAKLKRNLKVKTLLSTIEITILELLDRWNWIDRDYSIPPILEGTGLEPFLLDMDNSEKVFEMIGHIRKIHNLWKIGKAEDEDMNELRNLLKSIKSLC